MRLSINRITQNIVLVIVIFATLSSCEPSMDGEAVLDGTETELQSELAVIADIFKDDPEGALMKADALIEAANASSNKLISGQAKFYKAKIYNEAQQDVSKAYFHYNEALKDLERTDNSLAKKKVLNNLGVLYRFYGQYDAAINSYEKALELAPDLSDKDLSNLYYNYGVALKVKGDEDSFYAAEEAFTKSLEYARQIDYHGNIADVNNQIGMMYKDVKDYEMARIAYKNNIRSYQGNTDMTDYVGRAYHGIGVTYMEEGNVEEAVRAFEQALVYKTRSSSIFVTKYDLGSVLLQGGYKDEAIGIWKEALKESHSQSDIEQVQIYSKLSENLASNGDYKEAINYALIFNENVNKIAEEEKTYIAKNNKVLFQDIIREYDEFNAPQPFYADIKIMALLFLLSAGLIYLVAALYYRSKFAKRVSQTMSKINSEFQHIKVE